MPLKVMVQETLVYGWHNETSPPAPPLGGEGRRYSAIPLPMSHRHLSAEEGGRLDDGFEERDAPRKDIPGDPACARPEGAVGWAGKMPALPAGPAGA